MDILAARKRAAELAKKQSEPKEVLAAPLPAPEQQDQSSQSLQAEVKADVPPQAEAFSAEPGPGPGVQADKEPEPADTLDAGEEKATEDEATAEESAVPAVPDIEGLAVRIASEEYLMPIAQVREVLKIRETTPVPHAPEHAPGVISLRGDILPVIDLGKRLGLPPGTRDEKSRIVVVGLDDEDAGLIVDRVTGVVRYPADAVGPAPENVEQGGGAELLKGIVRKEGKLYILLDLEKAAGK